MPTSPIAILGRSRDTVNYENFLRRNGFSYLTTMEPGEVSSCLGLILPGGGDITPAFFGQRDCGSRNIDTELDILQLQALDICIAQHKPVLGICKGMQLINIAFGGTILQDMPRHCLHLHPDRDLYHPVRTENDSVLTMLYGTGLTENMCVNSAHHQCIHRIGKGLRVIQRCCLDDCPEAVTHDTLPILGLQWHPERLNPECTALSGAPLLSFFLRHST